MKQEIMGWQWHQLHNIQIICTLIETDNCASTSKMNFFTGQMFFLTPSQQHQSTGGNFLRLKEEEEQEEEEFVCQVLQK